MKCDILYGATHNVNSTLVHVHCCYTPCWASLEARGNSRVEPRSNQWARGHLGIFEFRTATGSMKSAYSAWRVHGTESVRSVMMI